MSEFTVRQERKKPTARNIAVDQPRIGRDGKARKAVSSAVQVADSPRARKTQVPDLCVTLLRDNSRTIPQMH